MDIFKVILHHMLNACVDIKVFVAVNNMSFLTRRLHKQSKGFGGGADYANDMQMTSFHHLWTLVGVILLASR